MKLQNCHGNISCISIRAKMASRFKTVTIEEVTKLKEAAENLNTWKSTINWVRVFEKWCDENSLEKNLEMILPDQLDKVLEGFYNYSCERNLSPTTLKGNQMVFSCNPKIISLAFCQNSDNFPRLKAREIIRILTKRARNYFLISLVAIWLHILINTLLIYTAQFLYKYSTAPYI